MSRHWEHEVAVLGERPQTHSALPGEVLDQEWNLTFKIQAVAALCTQLWVQK